MSTTTTTLPSLPSALIRLALNDLLACERDEGYRVSMTCWHVPVYPRMYHRGQMVCQVGLAGAVLAKTLRVPREQFIYSADLDQYGRVEGGLRALDFFRLGEIEVGLRCLGFDYVAIDVYGFIKVEYDESDPDEFHERMHRRADFLAAHGL